MERKPFWQIHVLQFDGAIFFKILTVGVKLFLIIVSYARRICLHFDKQSLLPGT